MDGVVCPIYKKGDKLDCSNYRGITLINAYKILSQILCRLLSPHAQRFVGPYQAGFTGTRASTYLIFSLRQILEKCLAHASHFHRFQGGQRYSRPRAAVANHARERFPGQTNSTDQGNLGSCDVSCTDFKGISGALRITPRVTTR